MTLALVAILAVQAATGDPAPVFYRAYAERTGETLWEFSVVVEARVGGGVAVRWRSESGDRHRQQYRLGDDYATLEWRVQFQERNTDYVGERHGRTVVVRGRLKGDEVDQVLEIDERPFFYSVPVGLGELVRSGGESIRFWAFRPDEVAVYAMDARVEGVDTLVVGDAEVEAVRVRWAPTGWRGLFFSRRFWFRKSDGLFVRTDARDGYVTELTGEGARPRP